MRCQKWGVGDREAKAEPWKQCPAKAEEVSRYTTGKGVTIVLKCERGHTSEFFVKPR